MQLGDGREALLEQLPEGFLLRLPRARAASVRRPALALSFLRERPVAVLDGRELLLTLRRAELLALLALHPGGLTAEQLAPQLYGEDGTRRPRGPRYTGSGPSSVSRSCRPSRTGCGPISTPTSLPHAPSCGTAIPRPR